MLRNTLASVAFFASVVLAEHAYQTFPTTDTDVYTSIPLTIRWEVHNGPSVPEGLHAPEMLSAFLGTHTANGAVKIYKPALNKPAENGNPNSIPLRAKEFVWNWDLNQFKDDPLAPRGANGNKFFIQLIDHAGYTSSGQKFSIIESAGGQVFPTKNPEDAPAGTANSPNANTPTNPTTASAAAGSTGSTGSASDPSPKPKANDAAGNLSPRLAVAATAIIACVGGFVL